MKNVTQELVKKIKEINNGSRDSDIEVIMCTKETDIRLETPLLLLCIGNHAIVQEIKKTTQGVSGVTF